MHDTNSENPARYPSDDGGDSSARQGLPAWHRPVMMKLEIRGTEVGGGLGPDAEGPTS
ncbi:MAG: hypothetical protein HY816_22760 [Candidatus Wallbacteria bacterium]|nr:hypothetical protein [Candidatus Wallbacteria bacterium]